MNGEDEKDGSVPSSRENPQGRCRGSSSAVAERKSSQQPGPSNRVLDSLSKDGAGVKDARANAALGAALMGSATSAQFSAADAVPAAVAAADADAAVCVAVLGAQAHRPQALHHHGAGDLPSPKGEMLAPSTLRESKLARADVPGRGRILEKLFQGPPCRGTSQTRRSP